MDEKTKKLVDKILKENSDLFDDLAKGPQGEYHHSLEEKLLKLINENKKLKTFIEEVAKGPYRDSDAKSLLLTLKTRARTILNE